MGGSSFDGIVVGSGHAGCEAALAAARLGCRTLCVTINPERTGHMPCNCSVGGPAKGHLVREVDALGGQMAINTDLSLTHIRYCGEGKGPSIRTLRAHACKNLYPLEMRRALESQPNLTLAAGVVEELIVSDGRVLGVRLSDGTEVLAKAVVLTTGTFLNGLCHVGHDATPGARHGDPATQGVSGSLRALGVRMRRFKTGTTPRVDARTVDFDELGSLPSDPTCPPFSFVHDSLEETLNAPSLHGRGLGVGSEAPSRCGRGSGVGDLLPCWTLSTNEETHRIIRDNLERSAMYGGRIKGIGPRYCPSIEDKVVRFAHKQSHPVFLEQEEWDSPSLYVQGTSTSLPEDVQLAFLRSMPGLRRVEMLRAGYAVEYDMADPQQLEPTLMSKLCHGLLLAGQVNGTSGYEEAAAQGIVAGINAARLAQDAPPVHFPRSESFIGVLIDDLVTKGVEDPYRMLTARAEYRLWLRHDNADVRLTPLAREIGLCDDARWQRFSIKRQAVESELASLRTSFIGTRDNAHLGSHGLAGVSNRTSLFDLLRRPEVTYETLHELGLNGRQVPKQVAEQVQIIVKYEGYLAIQERQVRRQEELAGITIPPGFDYESIPALSAESREKLSRVSPLDVGQASRVPGVRPTDISILLIELRRRGAVAR